MRILLVGAGAVGQVYGHYLQRSGARVDCFVRPRYVSQARAGFKLYRLDPLEDTVEKQWIAERVFSERGQLEGQPFDQVWLCVSATSLSDEELSAFHQCVSPLATIVSLQPGVHVMDRLRHFFPNRPLVSGLIGMVSYQCPLKGDLQTLPPGVAYMLSPFSPSLFGGAPEATKWVTSTLRAEGCPAKAHPNTHTTTALSSCFLMPHVVGLECAGWSIDTLFGSELGNLAAEASRQALRAVATELGVKPPALSNVIRPSLVGPVFQIAKRFAPFSLEPYLAYHFTKVGAQTNHLMEAYRAAANRAGLPNDALEKLNERYKDVRI